MQAESKESMNLQKTFMEEQISPVQTSRAPIKEQLSLNSEAEKHESLALRCFIQNLVQIDLIMIYYDLIMI